MSSVGVGASVLLVSMDLWAALSPRCTIQESGFLLFSNARNFITTEVCLVLNLLHTPSVEWETSGLSDPLSLCGIAPNIHGLGMAGRLQRVQKNLTILHSLR